MVVQPKCSLKSLYIATCTHSTDVTHMMAVHIYNTYMHVAMYLYVCMMHTAYIIYMYIYKYSTAQTQS